MKSNLARTALLIFGLSFCTSFGLAQTTKSYIEKTSGWQSCSTCAGSDGSVTHSMTQNISSPSMGSGSARYYIGGSTPFDNVLWWQHVGSRITARNYQYDVNFYMKNPAASQALEFDVVETNGTRHLTFAVQCELHNHIFRVWSNTQHWTTTGISCPTPAAYTWNHLTVEYYVTSGGNAEFVSMTLNGAKHYINKTEPGKTSTSTILDTSFQMDQNDVAAKYDTYIENMSIKYW